MSSLQGKIAAVTGAGSGIGRATALRFAREGAIVHLADRHSDPVEAVADEIRATGARATACTVDVTDAEAVQTWADAVFDADGRVDVLYNNAGIGAAGPAESMDAETWRRIIEVNLIGVANGVCAFGPRMLEQSGGGHIVNTASLAGLVAMPGLTAYAASKHGVVGLSESLNAEWEKEGVRVTAICPGIIDTPMQDKVLADVAAKRGLTVEELATARNKTVPLGRSASADECAGAIWFLLSSESGYMTGQAINYTGGLVMW